MALRKQAPRHFLGEQSSPHPPREPIGEPQAAEVWMGRGGCQGGDSFLCRVPCESHFHHPRAPAAASSSPADRGQLPACPSDLWPPAALLRLFSPSPREVLLAVFPLLSLRRRQQGTFWGADSCTQTIGYRPHLCRDFQICCCPGAAPCPLPLGGPGGPDSARSDPSPSPAGR